MLGTQFLPVADVCSKGQGYGEHVYNCGLDLTLVETLWYFGLSDTLPAWGLRFGVKTVVSLKDQDSAFIIDAQVYLSFKVQHVS